MGRRYHSRKKHINPSHNLEFRYGLPPVPLKLSTALKNHYGDDQVKTLIDFTAAQTYSELAVAISNILPKSSGVTPARAYQALCAAEVVDEQGKSIPPDIEKEHWPDTVYIYRPIPDEPTEPIKLKVVADLPGILVINKPHGMASMPRGSHVATSAIVAARRQFKNNQIVPAHRLDWLTGGLIVLVTDPQQRGYWQSLFSTGRVRKRYYAISEVNGHKTLPSKGWHTLSHVLNRQSGKLQTQVREVSSTESPNAITSVRVVDTWICGGQRYVKWELEPATGKTHQLRAQLNHLGFGIWGDPLYPEVLPVGEPKWLEGHRLECAGDAEKSQVECLHLCANRLEIFTPDAEVIKWEI